MHAPNRHCTQDAALGWAGKTYIIDCGDHVCSAGPISAFPVVTLCLAEAGMNVVNGALAADKTFKVLLDLQHAVPRVAARLLLSPVLLIVTFQSQRDNQ